MANTERFYVLDGLRAYSMLIGIVCHVGLSFMPALGTNGWAGWPIHDNSPSLTLTAGCFLTRMCRMINFFMIAGFSARLLFLREGPMDFFKVRAGRIAGPMIVSWIVLMPMFSLLMHWAYAKFDLPPSHFPPPKGSVLPFPLAHLWFLWLLLVFYFLCIGARALIVAFCGKERAYLPAVDRVVRWVTVHPLGTLLPALPLAAALVLYEPWRVWMGIPTPDRALVPNWPALIGFGIAFSFGWLFHRQTELFNAFEKAWPRHLAVAVILSVVCMTLGGFSPGASGPLAGGTRVICAVSYAVAGWSYNFAIFGLGMRFLSKDSPVLRYLSDSSYWGYLVHLPIVIALQIILADWPLHWTVKVTVITAIAIPLTLLSYHYWVRSTIIGEILNGHRYRRTLHRELVVSR